MTAPTTAAAERARIVATIEEHARTWTEASKAKGEKTSPIMLAEFGLMAHAAQTILTAIQGRDDVIERFGLYGEIDRLSERIKELDAAVNLADCALDFIGCGDNEESRMALRALEILRARAQAGTVQPSSAARDVLAERARQVSAEGWTPNHDDGHSDGSISAAAAAYAFSAYLGITYRACAADPLGFWPWDAEWWKPSHPRRDLVKAGALILAEIERLDRAALASAEDQNDG